MFQRKILRPQRTVIVHTRDGRSFVAVLMGDYPDGIALRHAAILPDPRAEFTDPVPVAGDVILPHDNVSWIQQDVPDSLLPPRR